jgi:hypothetical protein
MTIDLDLMSEFEHLVSPDYSFDSLVWLIIRRGKYRPECHTYNYGKMACHKRDSSVLIVIDNNLIVFRHSFMENGREKYSYDFLRGNDKVLDRYYDQYKDIIEVGKLLNIKK